MKIKTTAGIQSKLTRVRILDSTSTTGGGLTGLVYNSSGLTAYYFRDGDTVSHSFSLVTASLGTWVSGGFKEVDATNMPGVYELGIPNTVLSVAGTSHIVLRGATNMVDCPIECELDAVNYQDGVRAGLNALPNAVAGAITGLPVTDGLGNVQAALANASLQNFARLASGQQFHNVWFVDPANGNDIFTGKTPISAVSDGPFATINKAISVAGSGDLILLSGGTHTPTGACSIPDGVSARGQGINVTFIDGHSLTISGNGCIVRPGSNARLSDLTILGDSTIGNFTAPIGYDCGSQNPPVNALVERVRTYGWSDGIYVKAKAGQTCSIRFRDCIFESGYDTLNAIPNSAADVGTINLELENCQFIGAGPAGRGDPVRCVCHEANGTIRMWGGRIDATSAGSGAVYGVVTVAQSGNTNAPVIRCYGVEIYTSGGASHNDFANGIGTITETDCTYDPATITGTVTQRQPALPAIPNGWITANGVAAAALNGKGDWLLASSYTTPPTTGAIATAVMTDVADTIGADVVNINAKVNSYLDVAVSSRMATFTLPTNFSSLTITGGGAVTAGTVSDKTGYALAAAGLDSVIVESGITASAGLVNDSGTQLTSINARQAFAAILAASAGVLSGAATTSISIEPAALPAANPRVSATVDANGNRSTVNLRVPT